MGTTWFRHFLIKNTHYLLTIDYFIWFPTVRKLQSPLSVIKHLKEIFTEIGVPRCIVSDGGTWFTSQEFKDFTRMWGIQHRVTSSTNAQSNGQAECLCTDYQEQSHQSHGRRGGLAFSHPFIHHNTLKPVYPHQKSY